MPNSTATALSGVAAWSRVLRIDQTMSRTAARALLDFQFAPSDVKRMQDLAAKAQQGRLSASESLEIDAYEQLGCLLDILHSKARRTLKRRKIKAG